MSGNFRNGISIGMNPVVNTLTTLERGLLTLFAKEYKDSKDFYVLSNLKKFKPSEDMFIYAQKTGQLPEICEVYYKREYICDISILDTPAMALQKINDGMIEMVTNKRFVAQRKEGKV